MSVSRVFAFPVATLLRDARLLAGALHHATLGPPVQARLKPTFATTFGGRITTLEKGGADQSASTGSIGALTAGQSEAVSELERLVSAARRSATLAFPQNDVRLRAEFQVGVHQPQDFASELNRARQIATATRTHAVALAEQGWIEADTDALQAAIDLFDTTDSEQESEKDRRKGLTASRNAAANALFRDCLTLQNAARLAFPSTRIAQDPHIVEARNRYLLDEFPPRGGASAGDAPDPHGSPTPPAPTPPA